MTYAYGTYVDPRSGVRDDLDWIKSEQRVKKLPVRAFKRSYRKLAEEYGAPFSTAIDQSEALRPTSFTDPGLVAVVANAVTEYQLTRVRREFEADEEFKQYADAIPAPAAILAPYFYCEPKDADAWLTVNMRLAAAAVKFERDVPLHCVVCADAMVLGDDAFLDRIRREVPETGVSAVWLWFSTFLEQEADLSHLRSLRDLVTSLSGSVEVLNMHGGYFSLALSKFGMAGISHGVGYGEQKDVVPVIGQNTPTVRYYLPALYTRLGVPDIERAFDALGVKSPQDFLAKVCDCPVCKGIVVSDLKDFRQFGETKRSASSGLRLVQTPAAAKRCRFHFLITRIRECDKMQALSTADLQAAFDRASSTWGRQPSLAGSASHLSRWRAALA